MRAVFTPDSWREYCDWLDVDKAVLKKINALISDACRDPFIGIGKPEPLRHALSGFWSRRITKEHRLVYQVVEDDVIIIQIGGHYSG